jgi:hypothetical protein
LGGAAQLLSLGGICHMNTLSFLHGLDLVTTIVIHTTVFCFALTAYLRTKLKAFACVASGTGLAVFMSSALYLYNYKFFDAAGHIFPYIYRVGFMVAITLYGTGTIQLIRRVSDTTLAKR